MRKLLPLMFCGSVLILCAPANAQDIDWKKVDSAMERSAAVSGSVHRYGIPRSDLKVTLDGVEIKTTLALGGWVAFQAMHGEAMVMGDLVVLQEEINPVMLKLLDGGLEVTAIHNHLLRASPMTMYMHVGGHGDPVKMAGIIRLALAASATPFALPPASSPGQSAVDLDTAQLDQIMGVKGQVTGGVYQFSVPRKDPVIEDGMVLPTAMGSANAIGFQPTGDGKAAITGDFIITGKEVNPVMRELRASGVEITAIHSHMLTEEPRLFFMHFWANDDALKLAKGVRAALERTAIAKN